MSFIKANTNGNVANFGAFNNQNASWKADGFINLYLPNKGGGRRKLGAIKLFDNKPAEAGLRAWLEEDPNRALELLQKLEIEYNSAEGSDESGFALD